MYVCMYFGSIVEDLNFFSFVFSRLSSNHGHNLCRFFFLWVLLLSTILCLFLNLWNQLLLPLNFVASCVSQHASIFDFILFLNQSLDTLLATALCSLNLASKNCVCWDLFLLLCLNGLERLFFFILFRVSSARILLLCFSHLNTSYLVTPCCFATVL